MSVTVAGRTVSRRVLVAALGVAVAAAGVAGVALTADRPAEWTPLDSVPGDVDYVGHVNASEYPDDDGLALAASDGLRFQTAVRFYDGPPFPRSFLFRPDARLNASAVETVTYYGRTGNRSWYAARVVEADWRPRSVVAAVESRHDESLTKGTRNDTTVYAGDTTAVAVLGNERFVVGNRTAVIDAVNVTAGSADSFDGELRRAYRRGEDGFVRFAYRFRPGRVPNYPFVTESVRRVEYVTSAYYLNRSAPDPQLGVVINVTTSEPDAARGVQGILNAGVTFYRFETGNATLKRELRKVRLETSGRTVGIRYETGPHGFRVMVRGLYRNQPEPASAVGPVRNPARASGRSPDRDGGDPRPADPPRRLGHA